MTTRAAHRTAIKRFVERWTGRGDELGEGRSFWIELVETLFDVNNGSNFFQFEKRVRVNGRMRRIDAYLPATKVLIEQKSINTDLFAVNQQTGETPYEQAKNYASGLRQREYPRWIITCNFKEFHIYDMNEPENEPERLLLSELENDAHILNLLLNEQQTRIIHETKISVEAGEIVKKLYQALKKQYGDSMTDEDYIALNKLCVRLVFCLYAEDSDLFESRLQFHDFLERQYSLGADQVRDSLVRLFKILNTPYEQRDRFGNRELNSFPYVNGGLFQDDNIDIPEFNDEIVQLLLNDASAGFNWSMISPTIFGAIFESTLESKDRRSSGMHYTSIENIQKVINPLFMDDLKDEFAKIKLLRRDRRRKLLDFQEKLGSLKFLDPACGSGNFLTETYIELRRMENEILVLTDGRQLALGPDFVAIHVKIDQFYGIEINDFAVSVAQTALWIAESQMLRKTEEILEKDLQFLPLKSYSHIVKGNALLMDWNALIPANELNYIMGNPPFVGASNMSAVQKAEVVQVIGRNKKLVNSIDYVGGWYYKAVQYIQNTGIRVALVSTNSIIQGEQVAPLWQELMEEKGLIIDFAYRPFTWNSEVPDSAHVHCVIIGFSCFCTKKAKIIYSKGEKKTVQQINPYLSNGPLIFIESRANPLEEVPIMTLGNKPTDDGNFIFNQSEKDAFVDRYPENADLLKRYIGAKDFINNNEIRYCLWLDNVSPARYINNREIHHRLSNIRKFRNKSSARPTIISARTPYKFFAAPQTLGKPYLVIPGTSSENREYIPIDFLGEDQITANSVYILHLKNPVKNSLYEFGVLTSSVHMAWMRTVAGRLESRYRYSGNVVYNNFIWPKPTRTQKEKIEMTAQAILNARANHPECTLAVLYNPLSMPSDLRRAHDDNDKAVMKAYGFQPSMDEAEIVAKLMKMYQKMTAEKEGYRDT